MSENRLKIVSITGETALSQNSFQNARRAKAKETQAKFERLWLIDPERFNPLRNCMEKERLGRTWELLTKYSRLTGRIAADIGCSAGVFSRRLRDAGAEVEAIDIAENALKRFREIDAGGIQLRQDSMPSTRLPDHHYQIILCTELIAEIERQDYRLFFSELARLIQPDGRLVCSSPIDINTEGGIEKLKELAQAEFDIVDEVFSYHALYLRIKRFFKAPSLFINCWKNPTERAKRLGARKGLGRFWFWLNTTPLLIWFWYLCKFCASPILRLLNNNRTLLMKLEKICRFLSDRDGISHYLFIAKRRTLPTIHQEEIPIERAKRKEVWD